MSLLPGYCSVPDCERPRLSGLDVCYSHNKLRNDEKKLEVKKPAKPIQRGAPPKRVSDKRAEELKEYKPMRKKFLTDNPECGARLEGCTVRSEEVHHKSMSALDFLNVDTWLQTCAHCHRVLEDLPAETRREMAFLIDVKERPTI